MKINTTIFLIIFIQLNVIGQDIVSDSSWIKKEGLTKPEPILGWSELYKLWAKKVDYPSEAKKNNIQGKVTIYIIVDKSGEVIETGLVSGIGYGCDEAALNGFRSLNLKWRPGAFNGKLRKLRTEFSFLFKMT